MNKKDMECIPLSDAFKNINISCSSEPTIIEAFLKYFLFKTLKPGSLSKESLNAYGLNSCIENYIRQALDCDLCDTTPQENIRTPGFEEANQPETAGENPDAIKLIPEYTLTTEQDNNDTILEQTSEEPETEAEVPELQNHSSAEERDIVSSQENPSPASNKTYQKILGVLPEVIETNRELIVRIKLPEGMDENSFDINISELHAQIRWKHGYTELLIPLPKGFDIENARAFVKDSSLELKIPRNDRETEIEISIRHS